MSLSITVSRIGATWIIDLDGTIFEHNGHLQKDGDQILPGVQEFWKDLSENDLVLIVTARAETFRDQTEAALKKYGLRYSALIMAAPHGERIVVNDTKPSGLRTALAIGLMRNEGFINLHVVRDPTL